MKSSTVTVVLALAMSAFAVPLDDAAITSTVKTTTTTSSAKPTSTTVAGFGSYGSYGGYGGYGAYSRAAEAEADIDGLLEMAMRIKARREVNAEGEAMA